jgi:hypothetical protein
MNAMLAHLESFSPEQDMDSSVAIANSRLGDLPDSLAKDDGILPNRSVAMAGARQRQDTTSSTFADAEAVLEMSHERALLRGL